MTSRRLLLALALLTAVAISPAEGRTSQVITAGEIEQRLTEELASQSLLGAGARLELDNPAVRLVVSGATPPTLVVENLSLERKSGRVTAFVASGGDPADGERLRVTGRIHYVVELPVLNRYVAPGETIDAADIDRVAFRSERLTQGVVAEAADLVGKTPRRAIRPQEPVRQIDVALPLVVRKGDLVTIVFETPGLVLTAQGKAAEDGAKGASIRVANTRSGRLLDAVVVGPGTVAIGGPRAAQF